MINKKIIKQIFDVFDYNEYTYETNQSLEKLKGKIRCVIDQKGIFNFRYNLTGYLKLDRTFELSKIKELVHINNGIGGSAVIIEGELIEREENQTNVEIQVKPNFAMILLPIIFGIIGIGSILNSIRTWNTETLLGGLFLIIIPLFWGLLKYEKKSCKSEFESALGLSESEIIEDI